MAFIEVAFPNTIAEGAHGGRRWSTGMVRNRGGVEKSNKNWATPLGRWVVTQKNRTLAQTLQLQGFFHAVAIGKLNSFRFFDIKDCFMNNVAARRITDTTFQMRQVYTYGGVSFLWDVRKPVRNDNALTISLGNAPTTAYTLDETTGIFTTTSAIATTVRVGVTGYYHLPARLDTDDFDPEAVDANTFSWPDIVLTEVRL